MNRLSPACFARVAAVLMGLAVLCTAPVLAQQPVQPLPPDATTYGMKLSDWAVSFMQWFASIPKNVNPFLPLDSTGASAGIGQHGPVWFLPTAQSGTVASRTLTVPEGQTLLFAPAGGFSISAPGTETEDQVLANVQPISDVLDKTTRLEARLDGAAIPNLDHYRVQTPVFSITLPTVNLFDWTLGKDHRVVAAGDGYFLLLPPLSAGTHVLEWWWEGPDPDGNPFKTHVTLNLVVLKPNDPLP